MDLSWVIIKPIVLFMKSALSRCWFQLFFIFTPIWGRFPFWQIFFKAIETTNQLSIFTIPPHGFNWPGMVDDSCCCGALLRDPVFSRKSRNCTQQGSLWEKFWRIPKWYSYVQFIWIFCHQKSELLSPNFQWLHSSQIPAFQNFKTKQFFKIPVCKI